MYHKHMKKNIFFIVSSIAVVALSLPSIIVNAEQNDEAIQSRKIIIWNKVGDESEHRDRISRHGRFIKDVSIIHGSVAELSDFDADELASSKDVLRIDDDPVASIAIVDDQRNFLRTRGNDAVSTLRAEARAPKGGATSPAPQVTPWGITAINAPLVWPTGNTANPIKVGVIDTGISSSHPDLKANIKGGVNTINSRRSWNDNNGHGAHVAGIIAGINNTQGVVGGAPQADLYAIKVLGANGSGYYSDIIEGLQWAIANRMQVVNMSLGGTTDYQPLHDAVIAAKNAGILVVAAAGNSGGSVIFPAAYDEALAVSATDSANNIASFSSRGAEVDIAAPGVSIYSTYKGTAYATLSGTSMAAPHVTAAAALVFNTSVASSTDSNNNGLWDPNEVFAKLTSTAVDLGTAGLDNLFGYGLVNALAATQ